MQMVRVREVCKAVPLSFRASLLRAKHHTLRAIEALVFTTSESIEDLTMRMQ